MSQPPVLAEPGGCHAHACRGHVRYGTEDAAWPRERGCGTEQLRIPDASTAAAPAWVLPYADMMTLLLACFVLLASMSEVKEDNKFLATADSLRDSLGGGLSAASLIAGAAREDRAALDNLVRAGRARRAEALGGTSLYGMGDDGADAATREALRNAASAAVPFDPDGATLSVEGRRVLAAAAREIGSTTRQIEIRAASGVTSTPTAVAGKGPWDSAFARCETAMRYLVTLGVDPTQIRAAVVTLGYRPNRGGNIIGGQSPSVEVALIEGLDCDADRTPPREPPAGPVAQRPRRRK